MAVDQKDWTGSAVSYVQQRYYAAGQELTSAIAPNGGDAVTFLAPAGSFVTAAGFRFGYTGPAGNVAFSHSSIAIMLLQP